MARQWQASSSCSIASGNLSHAACLPPVSSVVILLPVCLIVMTVPGGKIFGGVESWVDTSKAAGCTSQVEQLGLENTIRQIVTLKYFFYSPNLVWFILAFVIYAVAPYDIPAARTWSWSWILPRLFLNFAVAFAYYGFFYFGLYISHWSSRKFSPEKFPTAGNMAHNLYYWILCRILPVETVCLDTQSSHGTHVKQIVF